MNTSDKTIMLYILVEANHTDTDITVSAPMTESEAMTALKESYFAHTCIHPYSRVRTYCGRHDYRITFDDTKEVYYGYIKPVELEAKTRSAAK